MHHQKGNNYIEIIISSCDTLPGSKTEQAIPIFSLNHTFNWDCLKKAWKKRIRGVGKTRRSL